MKLSIISINRNNAAGLRQTIESVVSQTYTDFEYIIIDGASTDDSVNIIKQYAHKIDYWVSEPDKGIYNAMNKGILKATGEYLLFLNSGDWLVDEILNKVFSLGYIEDIIYGNIIIAFENGEMLIEKSLSKPKLTFNDFYNRIICHHQASFIKKNVFDKLGNYDESYKIVADALFFINAIVYNNVSIKYIDYEISYYDAHGLSSIENDEKNKMLRNLLPQLILEDYETLNRLYKENEILKLELNRYKHRFKYLDQLTTFCKKTIQKLHHK